MTKRTDPYISIFAESIIKDFSIPVNFTYPFYYKPHPLAIQAAQEVQFYLETQTDLQHNFGLDTKNQENPIGKMFGVLVVKDTQQRIGYLAAFSGKLAGSNHHVKFVPPVFDMLTEDSFFLKEEKIINQINDEISRILADDAFFNAKIEHNHNLTTSENELAMFKKQLKLNKQQRDRLREDNRQKISSDEFSLLEKKLIDQSLFDKRQLRDLTQNWKNIISLSTEKIEKFENRLTSLKIERRDRSAALQKQLFGKYQFLNILGRYKSLEHIFKSTPIGTPPAAAGECALPKLLQYAFLNKYQPLAMAEFWWGASPKSEIRQHKQFYPSCTGKCKPILAHMLDGMRVESNPLLEKSKELGTLDVIFEDENLLVVNKPAGLRSVPGVTIFDSVYARLKVLMDPIEPLMIHRLDMDTSGLLVVAKNAGAHRHIQRQFLQKTVKKRYTAILSKVIDHTDGIIDLPLAADYINAPRQMVCFETGKKSITEWKVIERRADTTLIHFWPLTGRTHQLRMHAAHVDGLNAPIVGDDLYGNSAERMYLHAASIEFLHPQTKQLVKFEVGESF